MWKLSLIVGLTAAAVFAQDDTPDKRLLHAQDVLQSINAEQGIPHDLFAPARCVIIVPGLKTGAVIVGGDYGRGFADCRSGDSWAGPAAIRVRGGSFGAQLGVESTDLLILVMNQRGMDRLSADKFTIGADASAAIGPVGRTASAGTDATLRADLVTYARTKGVFAGVALDGTTITQDHSEDRSLYGRDVKNGEIIRGQIQAPAVADPLIAELNSISGQNLPAAQVAQATPPAPPPLPNPVPAEAPSDVPQSTPGNLPQTASPYPAMGLLGLLLIGSCAWLRRRRAES
jgi:SH3 domain-containing YSC84-like protein 1